jgi:Ala-tRNA(Pro) deacylase
MSVPSWILEHLDDQNVRYDTRHHRPAFTTQMMAAEEHVSGHRVGKVTIAIAGDTPVLLVLPASRRVDLARAREQLGAGELRLAREEEIARSFPDCQIGAIPPLRHWPQVEIWVDESLKQEGEILFQAGTHEDSISMRFADWMRITEPKTADFSRRS